MSGRTLTVMSIVPRSLMGEEDRIAKAFYSCVPAGAAERVFASPSIVAAVGVWRLEDEVGDSFSSKVDVGGPSSLVTLTLELERKYPPDLLPEATYNISATFLARRSNTMENENAPRLYVGNLPYVAQKAEIEQLFADNNVEIRSIDMSIDPFNGRNPSYFFVDFHTQDQANRAMETMQGKPEVPTPDPKNPQNAYVYDRWSRDDAPSRWTAPSDEGRRLWVGGLAQVPNQDVLNVEMRALFQRWDIEAVSKIISPNDHQRTKNGTATPYGGSYRIRMGKQLARPTKVMREQLGVTKLDRERGRSPPPARDLEGSWRRRD
ncbi:Uu.00g065560.m01.CDS01 [Anthostomella pinea]|uniref:Uu.00g065560.m01.CDS01 n=1 Tax=Anthostomella pinea TaxID=933095 RepID=A0AAI8VN70_9PEZI|nr:Uu.00g065560.m01.CDS01 [Anthostomella pinea]